MTDRLTLSLPVGALERLEATVRAAGVRGAWRVARRSLDARRGRDPRWVLALDIAEPGEELPAFTRAPSPREPRRRSPPVLVAGAGPAGLFAATALAEAGVPVEVLDRGEGFPARHFQARDLRLHGVFNPESNLRFGLGGAGTYSDGKLFTRKRGPRVEEVLARLAWLAGDEDLVVEAHPHVGTNRLIPLLERLRRALEDAGVRFRFGVRAEGLLLREGRVCGLRTTAGDLEAAAVILAPGNAARDTFAWLHRAGVALVSRPFAVGVRVEHPRALIDAIQYGAFAGHPELGAAEYRLAFPAGERGVFSFCMCPGGHVLPVPAEPGGLAVNGASHAARGSPFSNAALVVTTGPGDWGGGDDPLAGVAFQRALEQASWTAGGGACAAPAQRVTDLLAGRTSRDLPPSSYRPGLAAADLAGLLPPWLLEGLREGLRRAGAALRGFVTAEALAVAVETTTASPVQLLRDPDGASVTHPGLFPCGEGAGWAGGITSSAADGLAAAAGVVRLLGV